MSLAQSYLYLVMFAVFFFTKESPPLLVVCISACVFHMHHCKWTLCVRRFSDWTALVVEVSFETLKVKEENVRKFSGYVTTAIFEEMGIYEERKRKV